MSQSHRGGAGPGSPDGLQTLGAANHGFQDNQPGAARQHFTAPPPIEILDVRPLTSSGNVRAFVSIRLHGLTIHGCKVVQQPGQRPWASLPSQQSKDGKWFAVVETDNHALKAAIQTKILEAWEAEQR